MILNLLQFVLAFVLVLAPLVFIHELGHFLAAKLLRIGVPVFSLGFGPRLVGFRRGDTDYRLSLVPLGGYVRLAGDESDELRHGAPEEFLSRPGWQRLVVFLAGPAFNLALAFLVMWAYFATVGKVEVPYTVVYGVTAGSAAELAGVERGDKIVAISGRSVEDARSFQYQYNVEIALAPGTRKTVTLERGGKRFDVEIRIDSDPKLGMGDPGWSIGRGGGESPVIARVLPGGAAEEAGLRAGDRILAAGDKRPITGLELQIVLEQSVGRTLDLGIERDGSTIELPVKPRSSTEGRTIGIDFVSPPEAPIRLGIGAAAGEAVDWCLDSSKTLFVVLKRLVSAELSLRTMSGPVGIAQVARDALASGASYFVYLLAFFSLQLGILNLLPIPILDGGHILILVVEAVMRRSLSETLKERVMQAGLVFLLAFMSIVIVLDLSKLELSSLF